MGRRKEKGQVILEAALMIPVLVFVALAMIDIQWMLKDSGNLEYIVNEVARCEAIGSMACTTPTDYVTLLASRLRLNLANLEVTASGCDPAASTCTVTAAYNFHPVGVWFPSVTITRTGTASIPKAAM